MTDLRIGNLSHPSALPGKLVKQEGASEFGKVIKGAIEKVNTLDKEADQSIMDLLKGKADIHETMVALQKVDVSMRLLVTVRNKAVEAYKEIMHMQF
jgi:flagellar hook-basal body complex protein FliE